jgi:hypothetical protein
MKDSQPSINEEYNRALNEEYFSAVIDILDRKGILKRATKIIIGNVEIEMMNDIKETERERNLDDDDLRFASAGG